MPSVQTLCQAFLCFTLQTPVILTCTQELVKIIAPFYRWTD